MSAFYNSWLFKKLTSEEVPYNINYCYCYFYLISSEIKKMLYRQLNQICPNLSTKVTNSWSSHLFMLYDSWDVEQGECLEIFLFLCLLVPEGNSPECHYFDLRFLGPC